MRCNPGLVSTKRDLERFSFESGREVERVAPAQLVELGREVVESDSEFFEGVFSFCFIVVSIVSDVVGVEVADDFVHVFLFESIVREGWLGVELVADWEFSDEKEDGDDTYDEDVE